MAEAESKRILDPIERVSEVLFGLIMVLTFTGTLSAAESGRTEVRDMLIGALGCNFAWGLIDAIMYLMGCLAERTKSHRMKMAVRAANNPEEANTTIARALPPVVASALDVEGFARIHTAILKLPEPGPHAGLEMHDFKGALGVFLLVFISTFPVALPFLFFQEPAVAIRLSNAVAVAMLFGLGFAFGKLSGYRPMLVALAMVVLGSVIVALTIALGG